MNRTFKIHCSQIGKIMGKMGLTEAQEKRLAELKLRVNCTNGSKPLTDKMKLELDALEYKMINPELPETAQTFLKEWYADDREEIYTKYVNKGNLVEDDLIDFMAVQLGLGMAEKNHELRENEYMIGTCDVVNPEMIIDVKAPWNLKTLQDNIGGINTDYEWQLRGYMSLWDKNNAIVFYGLMDTPAEINYDRDVIYSDMPDDERWIAYSVTRDPKLEQDIIDRVILCREWLKGYHEIVTSKMGRIN